MEDLEHAKQSRRVPVVFARQDVTKVLAHLTGTPHLMASLLSGAGLRLMECVCLRVKDVDFAYHQVIVRDGKGAQDRVTILPQSLEEALRRQPPSIPKPAIARPSRAGTVEDVTLTDAVRPVQAALRSTAAGGR